MELPPWFKMSGHGTELIYLFGLGEMSVKFNVTDEDYRLADRMIKYWTNFAKYGIQMVNLCQCGKITEVQRHTSNWTYKYHPEMTYSLTEWNFSGKMYQKLLIKLKKK